MSKNNSSRQLTVQKGFIHLIAGNKLFVQHSWLPNSPDRVSSNWSVLSSTSDAFFDAIFRNGHFIFFSTFYFLIRNFGKYFF